MSAKRADEGVKMSSLYKKYAKTTRFDPDPTRKLRPSEFNKSAINFNVDDYPKIIELNSMADNTAQVHSAVEMDQPLFQPSPRVIIFENYAPFTVHERKLFFRNNDSVRTYNFSIQCPTVFASYFFLRLPEIK
jgi:hypothetical protein